MEKIFRLIAVGCAVTLLSLAALTFSSEREGIDLGTALGSWMTAIEVALKELRVEIAAAVAGSAATDAGLQDQMDALGVANAAIAAESAAADAALGAAVDASAAASAAADAALSDAIDALAASAAAAAAESAAANAALGAAIAALGVELQDQIAALGAGTAATDVELWVALDELMDRIAALEQALAER